jgi:Zn-dependent M28 family amino/carboxypeptidase
VLTTPRGARFMKWLGRIGRPGRLCLCLILGSAVSTVSAAEHADVFAALNSIHVGELKQHVDYLASDDLEGREAGAAGGQTAGDYLIQLLQENGVQGAGDAGSYVQEFGNGYRNILGWIEGADPELKHQYVLVGAHYDHVGYGTQRNSFGPIGHVHNGADDNASGSSGLAEVMQAFALLPTPPKRSILFVWWDAEEKGMLGSKHWAAHPTIDLENLTCVFNMDMIGRLRNERIEVYGVRTGYRFRQLVSRENVQPKLAIDFIWDTKANSDHYPFFRREIPFLMLHTGLHDDYHRPRDDADKINGDGMQLVARLLFRLVLTMADRPGCPRVPYGVAVRIGRHARAAGASPTGPPAPTGRQLGGR